MHECNVNEVACQVMQYSPAAALSNTLSWMGGDGFVYELNTNRFWCREGSGPSPTVLPMLLNSHSQMFKSCMMRVYMGEAMWTEGERPFMQWPHK